ncbi:MAG: helix-turn-helix transcriptional regulator [Clostridia bacterium]|nr:helix-turn-helix transcriptional regulator [Clostridia bacterium]
MEEIIDIEAIPRAPRYIYTVEYIFHNQFETASAFVKRNDETGFHIQEFYEICVISKGEGYHVIEDTVVKAKKGDVFIVPPWRRHAIRGGRTVDVHYMHLSPKFFEQYLDKMTELPSFLSLFRIEPMMRVSGDTYRHLYLEDSVLNEVTTIIESLEGVWQHDHASKLILEGYMIVLLTIFCREYEKLQTKAGKNASNDKLFMDSISYVINNYNKRITIDELAHSAGLSRTAYIKRFRDTTGKSLKQFMTHLRITAAKKLLALDQPISRIAEECGFYDAAHFIKTFIAATGMSPTEYKKSDKDSPSQYKPLID